MGGKHPWSIKWGIWLLSQKLHTQNTSLNWRLHRVVGIECVCGFVVNRGGGNKAYEHISVLAGQTLLLWAKCPHPALWKQAILAERLIRTIQRHWQVQLYTIMFSIKSFKWQTSFCRPSTAFSGWTISHQTRQGLGVMSADDVLTV